MDDETMRRLRHNISMLALGSIRATAHDGAEVDMRNVMEHRLAYAGIFAGMTREEIVIEAGAAFKALNESDRTGDDSDLEIAIQEIKEWGYEKTTLAILAALIFDDDELGETEGNYFVGMAEYLGVDVDTQTQILIGVSALLRRFDRV